MQFLEVFTLKPADLEEFTYPQLRVLADRADEIIRARNAEQNGHANG